MDRGGTPRGDDTPKIAERLAAEDPKVRVLRLAEKGRGRALTRSWTASEAAVLAYAVADLKGVARIGKALLTGALPLQSLRAQFGRTQAGSGPAGLLWQLVRFGVVGVASTLAYLMIYLVARQALPAQAANALALLLTAIANTAANRRLTFGFRGTADALRHQAQGAYLNNKHRCPVSLLVITGDSRTEHWARQPIKIGLEEAPSQITQPLVAGPDNIPLIMDVDHARQDVMLAVLSALTHRHSTRVNAILDALAAALHEMDRPTAKYLAEFTEFGLGKSPAGQKWRRFMKSKYGFVSELHREWSEEGRAEGLAEGRLQAAANSVLRVFAARGLAVPEDVARRVNECTDLATLEGLLIQALTVERAEDLFADRIAG